MTPERLEAIREHLETTGYSHAFKPQAFELLEEVDRLRAGIEREAQYCIDDLTMDALYELLTPPTEGETDHDTR